MGVIRVWPQPVSLSFHIVAVDTLGEGEGHVTTMLCILQTNVEYTDFLTQTLLPCSETSDTAGGRLGHAPSG